MSIGDLYQVVTAFSNDATGKNLSFTLTLRQDGASAPDIGDVGDIMKEWWDAGIGDGDPYKGYCNAALSLQEVTLRRVEPLEPVIFGYGTGLPIAGTAATDQYTAQAGPLVSLRTGKVGKSYRGRMYLPPVAEGNVSASATLTAGTAEDIAEGIQGIVDAFNDVGQLTPMVVWSRKLSSGEKITSVLVDRELRTQRRRQDRAPVYVGP